MTGKLAHFGAPGLLELRSGLEYSEFCKAYELGFAELNMNFPNFTSDKLCHLLIHENNLENCFYSLHLPDNLDIAEFNREIRAGNVLMIKNIINSCKKGQIKILNLHLQLGNCFTLPTHVAYFYELYETAYLANIKETLEELVPLLKEKEITLCFENTGICKRKFIQHALDLILSYDNTALTWDIGHDAKYGYEDSKYYYESHLNQVKHVHIHDYNGTLDHCELFTGCIDLKKIIHFVMKKNIKAVIETKTIKTLTRSIEALKKEIV